MEHWRVRGGLRGATERSATERESRARLVWSVGVKETQKDRDRETGRETDRKNEVKRSRREGGRAIEGEKDGESESERDREKDTDRKGPTSGILCPHSIHGVGTA